jgi:hypothetical protein
MRHSAYIVIMLSFITQNCRVPHFCIIILTIFMLSVVMLSGIVLNVVAAFFTPVGSV